MESVGVGWVTEDPAGLHFLRISPVVQLLISQAKLEKGRGQIIEQTTIKEKLAD